MSVGYEYEDFSGHPWCSDPARDEAVRAAEDGRDWPLPTLEEAIAVARSGMADGDSWRAACESARIASGTIADLEAEIARLREERRWVSVVERLPDADCWYIAAIKHDKSGNTGVFVAEFWSDGVFTNCDFEDVTVTHWMPLPPGPEAAG